MARRRSRNMARPRSSGRTSRRSKQSGRSSSSQRGVTASAVAQSLWGWLTGPVGQQLLALTLIAGGMLTGVTIAGLNSGKLINAWARALVFAFGWGAYPVAGLLVALGLLWLRHQVHQATAWRWRPFLGWELTLLGLLTLTHTLIHQNWELVASGRGGGVVGWALHLFFSDAFGSLITGVLMGVVVILGLGLAFDLTWSDVQVFGKRLVTAWETLQAGRAQRRVAREPIIRHSPQASELPATPQVPSEEELAVAPEADLPAASPPAAEPALSTPHSTAPPLRRRKPTRRARRRREKSPTKQPLVPLSLLDETRMVQDDPQAIQRKSRIIEETLAQFGVPARVTDVRPGPTVTQFGVSPGYIRRGSEGNDQRKVRVSQIAALADDLALALAARSLRVEAPVPGRAVVGVEVPNEEIARVTLRAVLETETFERCRQPLCFAVGLDVAGSARVADLSRMPHLLVAGTTGSGKSVFVKALAISLIMYNSPEELRLVTIDPKIVELSHLNGLPHLLSSTVTDLEEILRALRWVAHEMDRRYKLFAASRARNLDDYNDKMVAAPETEDAEDEAEPLPRIVVLIDELADLMMSAPDETEKLLTRIAQMARATGIHMVVATQRPSTDVVTGLIKANFPARLSFATTSIVDSRVILDTPGAESLLGQGDMLFLPPDAAAPMRVQGCYISEGEVEKVLAYWQQEAGATPAKPPWEVMAQSKGPDTWRIQGQDEDAELLERALALAENRGKISTSGLQRRLHISYPRAARLMEQMEKMGVVGPQPSAGRKRRVIIGGDE